MKFDMMSLALGAVGGFLLCKSMKEKEEVVISLEVVTTLFVVEILFFLDDTHFVGCTRFAVVT